jgi:TPP-dependent pyruvate/acetoin dehydrogenase alpha subunit
MSVTFSNFKAAGEPPAAIHPHSDTTVNAGPEVSASPSDPAMLRKLYAAMLRCRTVEERAGELAQSHKLKLRFAMPHGLDASTVGSLMELRAGDAVVSDLGFAPRMFAGLPLGLYFADLYGVRAEYLAFAPNAADSTIHVLPSAPSVVAQLNVAAGFALALKRSRQRSVVLVHLPNGANSLGYWHEAALLAVSERLPIIFVAMTEQSNAGFFANNNARQRASNYGMPGITVDGDDVVAMWRVTQESAHRARAGAGPTLIDSQLSAASGKSKASKEDPLAHMQHYLQQRKLWDESWRDEIARQITAEVEEAQAFFLKTISTQ